jgi:type IX secretion system PorP/SprF family membrane protein
MRLKYLILPIIICFYGTVKSQSEDFDLSQRWFNESIYNPGATGNSFSTGVFLHTRAQWVGTDGAPITNAISFDTYVDEIKSGLGFAVYTEKIGYRNSWSAKLAYAYYIRIGDKSSLAFGLAGYLQNRNSHISPNMLDQSNDPVLGNYSKVNEYSPNFDFGLEFKGPLKIGASVRHLLEYEAINSSFSTHSITIWTYASSRFNISNSISLEPVASYMYNDKDRIEGGAIVYFFKNIKRAVYNDRFWLGGMYRLNKQFAILVGANLTPKIRLGYSFDYGTGDLATISKMGTHELFLSWHFNKIFYKEPDCPAYNRGFKRK